jgi:hypothetical protein
MEVSEDLVVVVIVVLVFSVAVNRCLRLGI